MYICVSAMGIPSDEDPGYGIFEFDQAKALAALNNKVIYAALDTRSCKHKRSYGFSVYEKDSVLVYLLSVPIGGIPTKYNNIVFSSLYTRIQACLFRRLMRRIIKNEGTPDIVHSHFLDVSSYTSRYCSRNHLSFVLTEHWSLLNKDGVPQYIVKKAKDTYKRASVCLCVSTSFAKQLIKLTDVDFKVIPNIVSTESFYYYPRKRKENEFSFVSCGMLGHRKGHDILIRAFKKVHDVYPCCFLRIIGGGEDLNKLVELSSQLSLQDNVIFCGELPRDRIREIYNISDAFVLASRGETFGVVYIEAMATGLPVIATVCGGPENFITDEMGMLVPIDDIDSLSNAMIKVVENIGDYNGEKIAQTANKMFSPEKIANQLMEVYFSVKKSNNSK